MGRLLRVAPGGLLLALALTGCTSGEPEISVRGLPSHPFPATAANATRNAESACGWLNESGIDGYKGHRAQAEYDVDQVGVFSSAASQGGSRYGQLSKDAGALNELVDRTPDWSRPEVLNKSSGIKGLLSRLITTDCAPGGLTFPIESLTTVPFARS